MPRYTESQLAEILKRQGHAVDFVVPKARKKRSNEESRAQQSLILWWDTIASKQWGIPHFMLFAVGNGGARSAITGAIMKREGIRKGTSDLILLVARGKYHALCLELKTATGNTTIEQDRFLVEAQRRGYAAGCAYSTQDAVRFIEAYLRGEEFL